MVRWNEKSNHQISILLHASVSISKPIILKKCWFFYLLISHIWKFFKISTTIRYSVYYTCIRIHYSSLGFLIFTNGFCFGSEVQQSTFWSDPIIRSKFEKKSWYKKSCQNLSIAWNFFKWDWTVAKIYLEHNKMKENNGFFVPTQNISGFLLPIAVHSHIFH